MTLKSGLTPEIFELDEEQLEGQALVQASRALFDSIQAGDLVEVTRTPKTKGRPNRPMGNQLKASTRFVVYASAKYFVYCGEHYRESVSIGDVLLGEFKVRRVVHQESFIKLK